MIVPSTASSVFRQVRGLDVLTWPVFDAFALDAFVTTRAGGVSAGGYGALNLSLRVGDDPAHVLENRRRAAAALDADPADFVFAAQVHGNVAQVVGAADRGRGTAAAADAIPGADVLVTADPGTVLAVLAADCVPIVLYDPAAHVLACAHAGWRGTVARAAASAVAAMESLGAHPADIVAGIGPAAFPYQVGAEVADAATAAFGAEAAGLLEPVSPGQWNFGLWAANRIVLRHAGVPDVNIHVTDVPTGPSPATSPSPAAAPHPPPAQTPRLPRAPRTPPVPRAPPFSATAPNSRPAGSRPSPGCSRRNLDEHSGRPHGVRSPGPAGPGIPLRVLPGGPGHRRADLSLQRGRAPFHRADHVPPRRRLGPPGHRRGRPAGVPPGRRLVLQDRRTADHPHRGPGADPPRAVVPAPVLPRRAGRVRLPQPARPVRPAHRRPGGPGPQRAPRPGLRAPAPASAPPPRPPRPAPHQPHPAPTPHPPPKSHRPHPPHGARWSRSAAESTRSSPSNWSAPAPTSRCSW